MREPNECTTFVIAEDGRPQAYLANYPSSLTPNYAYVFAWALQVTVTALALWMLVRFQKYRNFFPCNLLSTNLHTGMIIGQPFVVFAYTHYHIVPHLVPCWLHCIIMFFPYLCYGWMATASNFRNYILYTSQGKLMEGDFSSRIVRLRNVIRSSIWFETTVALSYLCLGTLPNLLRLAETPHEVLFGPMWDLRCTSFSSPVFAAVSGVSCLMMILNILTSYLSNSVKESYPFRYRYKQLSTWVARGLPFSQIPHYLKQFATGIDQNIYNHISWISLFIWAFTYSFPFLYHIAYTLTRDARAARFSPHQVSVRSPTNSSNRKVNSKVVEEDAILIGLLRNPANIAELKLMLSPPNDRIKKAFADYLQRELCVENILFTDSVRAFVDVDAFSRFGKKAALGIAQQYLLVGAPLEVNLSDILRSTTLKEIETTLKIRSVARIKLAEVGEEGAGTAGHDLFAGPYPGNNVFAACEDEIYRMMLEPFQRFVRKYKMT